jgi:hypothetical protein
VEHLKGFNVANRYLILLYYNPSRMNKKKVRMVSVMSARVLACSIRSCQQVIVSALVPFMQRVLAWSNSLLYGVIRAR